MSIFSLTLLSSEMIKIVLACSVSDRWNFHSLESLRLVFSFGWDYGKWFGPILKVMVHNIYILVKLFSSWIQEAMMNAIEHVELAGLKNPHSLLSSAIALVNAYPSWVRSTHTKRGPVGDNTVNAYGRWVESSETGKTGRAMKMAVGSSSFESAGIAVVTLR